MKKKHIILIHLLYWFYIINQSLFPMYIGKLDQQYLADNRFLNDLIISLVLNIISFYGVYYAFPKIVALKNKLLLVISSLFTILVLIAVRLPIDWFFWKFIGQLPEKEMVFQWAWVWNELRMVVITGIYAILIRFMIRAFEAQKLKDEIIRQQQSHELALLKSQINPHFLFNTLNNIYSLVYHKSDEAPDAVIKFSSIMRYVIYDATAEKIALDKEIEYLKSYIELQKLRFDQNEFVLLNIDGNSDGLVIAPMLLIPFVENAFKNCSKSHQPGVTILLSAEKPEVRFEVSYYLEEDLPSSGKQFTENNLSKIRRRLELLYPGKSSLVANEENGQFKVKLIIKT